MLKIMHFIHGLNTGGAETLVKEYALNLKNKNYDIVILCFTHCYDSPYEKLMLENNIKVIYVCDYMKYYNKKSFLFKCINYIQKYLLVKKIIHNENPDVLHTHLPINSYVKFAKPSKNTKIFHTVHSEPKLFWPNCNKDYKAAKWLVNKYNMRFICLHENMKNEINKMFNVNNSIAIKNGIDFSRFEKDFDRKKIRNDLGINNDFFVIGHIGRFNKVKNHDFLIDVFKEIYLKNKKAYLVMIGVGIEEENIINKLHELDLDNNYVILRNRTDIPELLSIMNVFIFPSLYEGLGISLIEAQKMKLPCFVSDRVPDGAIISNLVTKLSLDISSKEWSNIILNYKKPENLILDDEEWDIKKVIDKLERVYLEME